MRAARTDQLPRCTHEVCALETWRNKACPKNLSREHSKLYSSASSRRAPGRRYTIYFIEVPVVLAITSTVDYRGLWRTSNAAELGS
jgi:hypothetical protein